MAGKKKKVIWLCAPYKVLINETLAKVKSKYRLKSFSHFIVDDYRSFNWHQISDAQGNVSLFSEEEDRHFILLDLPEDPEKPLVAEGVKVILNWHTSVENNKYLIIRSPAYNFKVNRSAWYTQLKKLGVIIDIELNYSQSASWIMVYAKKKGIELSQNEAQLIYEKYDGNLDHIANEIEIASLIPNYSFSIGANKIDYQIHQITSYLARLDIKNVAKLLYRLREQKVLAIQIFYQISNFVNLNYQHQVSGRYLPKSVEKYQGGSLLTRYPRLIKLESIIKGNLPIPSWFAIIEYCKVLCYKI